MAISPNQTSSQDTSRRRIWFYLLIVALLIICCFDRILVHKMQLDWLNIIPLAATLYVGYCLIALEKTCGSISFFRRRLADSPGVPKPMGSFLLSPWFRSCLLLVITVMALEFGLRCLSYHRSLQYERQGDLLFTPIPGQTYEEKISLTESAINGYGLRGGPVDTSPAKVTILCLGDSITYGYGVDDAHSYPAQLQAALDREFPGRYSVLNGGVDAYPIAFEDEKFLYLWNRGLHPDVVFVGYSFNEGFLGHLVDSSEEVKREFARRVWLKNHLRSIALYNIIAEKWARTYYDRMKGKLVPGTNFAVLSKEEVDKRYEGYLERLLTDLQSRKVKPVFLLFGSFNGPTGRYNTDGPFEKIFTEFAGRNGLPLLRSGEMLQASEPENVDLTKYFIDGVHMNELGTQKVAANLAELVPGVLEKRPSSPTN
jgi:lysophospholipase L1-like esterase